MYPEDYVKDLFPSVV